MRGEERTQESKTQSQWGKFTHQEIWRCKEGRLLTTDTGLPCFANTVLTVLSES